MTPLPDRFRTVIDGGAGLACVLGAGAALACLQSGQDGAAGLLAGIAATIPAVALLARAWNTVGQAVGRGGAGDGGKEAVAVLAPE